jgi:hypothetical protein
LEPKGQGEGGGGKELWPLLLFNPLCSIPSTLFFLSYITVYSSDSTVSEDAWIEPRTVATFDISSKHIFQLKEKKISEFPCNICNDAFVS